MISRRRPTQAMTAAAAVGAADPSGAGQASAVTGTAAVKAPTGRAAYDLGPVRRTRTDVLDLACHDVGPAHGKPVILLYGWLFSPVSSYAEVAPSPGADTAATSPACAATAWRPRGWNWETPLKHGRAGCEQPSCWAPSALHELRRCGPRQRSCRSRGLVRSTDSASCVPQGCAVVPGLSDGRNPAATGRRVSPAAPPARRYREDVAVLRGARSRQASCDRSQLGPRCDVRRVVVPDGRDTFRSAGRQRGAGAAGRSPSRHISRGMVQPPSSGLGGNMSPRGASCARRRSRSGRPRSPGWALVGSTTRRFGKLITALRCAGYGLGAQGSTGAPE